MGNPTFADDENIPLVHDEDRSNDYDDYNTLYTSLVQEKTFTDPDTMQTTSTLRLRQRLKVDKIAALYRHLNVTGDPNLTDIDQFRLKKKNSKTGNIDLIFLR